MPRKNIKVIKVPISDEEKLSIYKSQIFPRLPRLYLELLENKIKIKQDLINKDYVPSDKKYDVVVEENDKYKKYDDGGDDMDKYTKKHDDDEYTKKYDDDVKDKYTKKYDEDDYNKKYTKKYDDDDDKDKYNKKYDEEDKYTKKYDNDNDNDKYKKYDEDDDKYTKKYNEDDDKKDDDFDSKLDDYISKNKEKEVEKSYSPSSNISDRLQQLLKDEPTKKSETPFIKKSNNLNYRSVENFKRHEEHENIPPTLSEIESQGGIKRKRELRDINNISRDEQEEEDLKRELMFKIDLLKKSYPNAMIPEFSIHSDYNTMKKTYDSTVRRLSLDSSVDNYKNYLIGGFMLCEFVLGSYMGFDMQGFTQQQILSMNSYEVLLIELGEKSYIPQGSKWPVEIRLIGLILINVVFFIVSKMIMKKTGSNLLGLINNMNVKNNNTNSTKRKMKGPNINLDEIPEIPV
jgi:hypothetical protein